MQECALPVGLFSSVQVSRPHCVSRCVCVERGAVSAGAPLDPARDQCPAPAPLSRLRALHKPSRVLQDRLHTQVGAIDVRKQISTDSNLHTTAYSCSTTSSPPPRPDLSTDLDPTPLQAARSSACIYSIAAEGCIFPSLPVRHEMHEVFRS